MNIEDRPGVASHEPAWFRRTSLSCATTAHEFEPVLYWSTSPLAFGHWPHPARMTEFASGPAVQPNACDSSHASGRSATPASFHGPVPPTEDSTIDWGVGVPAMLMSPPMA